MAKVILIVEDEPSNLKLVQDLLQLSGYETIGATDGTQGVELARARIPDLILMDIMMPKKEILNIKEEYKDKHMGQLVVAEVK